MACPNIYLPELRECVARMAPEARPDYPSEHAGAADLFQSATLLIHGLTGSDRAWVAHHVAEPCGWVAA